MLDRYFVAFQNGGQQNYTITRFSVWFTFFDKIRKNRHKVLLIKLITGFKSMVYQFTFHLSGNARNGLLIVSVASTGK